MKHIIKIVIVAVVALGVSAGLWFYLNGYLLKSKASINEARISFSEIKKQAKGGDIVQVGLTVTADSGISGVDIIFKTNGENMNFLYPQSTSQLPVGFDEQVMNESTMTTQTSYGTKTLKRMMFISKKSKAALPRSIFIPLHFAVVNRGQGMANSSLSVDIALSQVSGPSIPGNLFMLMGDRTPLDFTVEIDDPRAASATNLECNIERNTSKSNCGKGIAFKWTDISTNESGYKVYKNNELIKTLGPNATSYNDAWCVNFNPQSYSVIAYNAVGSVSTTSPKISCTCQICPTDAPPTPTPIRPTTSADLIFRVVFPNVSPTVNEVPNINITILDDAGGRVCDGDTDCAKVVTFYRVPNAKVANTFKSPQLQYPLTKNQAYSIVIKQNHTIRQTYKHVYLKWQKVLQCLEGTNDTGCGELIEVVKDRPLFSGDLDGSNGIDQKDIDIISAGVGVNSAEGDLNFDGATDDKDINIIGKNLNKKGT